MLPLLLPFHKGSLGFSDGDRLPERRGVHAQGPRYALRSVLYRHCSRSVNVAGITRYPDSAWLAQIARNITDVSDGFLRGGRYLILDRDPKYTEGFRHALIRTFGSGSSCRG